MLSRIAESLFWIGRYVERADATSRIVDTYLQHLLEDAWIDEDLALRSLLGVMGLPAGQAPQTRSDVLAALAYDLASPSSCAGGGPSKGSPRRWPMPSRPGKRLTASLTWYGVPWSRPG